MLLYKPFLIGSLCKTLNLCNLILMGALCGMILLQPRNNCIVELFIMILHADLYRRPPFFLQIFLFKWPFPWHILHTVNLLCCPQLWNNWHNLNNVYWIISCSTLWWQISVSPGNDVTCLPSEYAMVWMYVVTIFSDGVNNALSRLHVLIGWLKKKKQSDM